MKVNIPKEFKMTIEQQINSCEIYLTEESVMFHYPLKKNWFQKLCCPLRFRDVVIKTPNGFIKALSYIPNSLSIGDKVEFEFGNGNGNTEKLIGELIYKVLDAVEEYDFVANSYNCSIFEYTSFFKIIAEEK